MSITSTPPVGITYSDQPPYAATVTVAGLPVGLAVDANAFYVAAVFENVTINGSPLIAYFDPPLATVGEVSLPGLLLYLIGGLSNGAIIS